ncbi:MAG TPA: pyridoxal 5'-phosphate synthase glutaminase subunit PdxT [Candidatus Nanoarchaeia archaeon]|nr:pyridoxal 5'-phosphate synthase glutaminase subunit PdxT [Candidatus Nanoarchaeia archaeon]
MKIGVLALQGDFREHIEMLKKCEVNVIEVRLPQDLKGVNGLIIPGGESTTIGNLMQSSGLDKEIIKKNNKGMAIYGTCAGAILLAKEIIGSSQPKLNLLDVSIKRNDYGRQIDSFEAEINSKRLGKLNGVFIRAPVIEKVGKSIEVLAEFDKKPVLVQQGNILASAFHPELTYNAKVHQYFVNSVVYLK